jgi:hypothetical protein
MVNCYYKGRASPLSIRRRNDRAGHAVNPEVNRIVALLTVESGFLPAGLTSEKTKLTFAPAGPTLAAACCFAGCFAE